MFTGGFSSLLGFMLAMYVLVAVLWMLFSTIADLFRRQDVSGVGKAGWLLLLLLLPLVGILIYVLAKPATLK